MYPEEPEAEEQLGEELKQGMLKEQSCPITHMGNFGSGLMWEEAERFLHGRKNSVFFFYQTELIKSGKWIAS